MNLLAPLYIAGVIAVGLPIIFHLIRRTPQKRQTFSSLMFLAPSPPRLTRRSRLTNILLLILRAAALTLLAFAFARPFFARQADMNQSAPQGKRIALLVDTSASMRRGDLWNQAQKQVEQTLADLAPADEVSLFLFDKRVSPVFTFEQWNQLEPSRRAPMLQSRLSQATPTWASTNLGEALASVADQLAEAQGAKTATDAGRRQIVLISDLQQGSHVESLQGHEWPEGVLLDVKPLTLKESTNASLQLVKDQTDVSQASVEQVRVRVTNQPNSTAEQFTIAWENDGGSLPLLEPQKVYCPPGRSQIVHIALPPTSQPADRLVLHGDDFDFDNTLYLVAPKQEVVRVVYVGDDAIDDAKGLSYYLRSALTDTPQQKIDFVQRAGGALTDADITGARLIVLSTNLPDDRTAALRKWINAGGTALWVLKDLASATTAAGLANGTVEGSADRDFALLARVDLDNPLFIAFADPRFSDFTKIHFWKHRRITVRDPGAAKTIASFDDGDPFLLESSLDQGRLIVATAGWQPADSQLALSTKFVPLIAGLLQHKDSSLSESQYIIGDTISLPTRTTPWSLHAPDGRETVVAGNATSAEDTDRPGIYRLTSNQEQFPVAVNVSPDESRTAPLTLADLEQWGAKVGTQPPPQVLAERQRQLKLFELENRQKLWRWLLVAVLGLVAAETALAGKLSRRSSEPVAQQASEWVAQT